MSLPSFSNYTVIRELGQGGMATVYLAKHNTLGHQVAIKILDKQFAYNQNIKARFIEEAKKLVRLDHPNVVKVTDFISENEHVAYVMEYINGKSLRELLNAKRLTDTEIENYLNQMVVALNYIHKEGIVHRDIKPSNFIFATNGTLKLVDFGISKSIDATSVDHTSTSTNLSMGTLLYMSPEQIKSTKDVTYLSDIYSLGVVLWEMAMGKVPYNSNELSSFEIQVKIVQEKLPKTNTRWDLVIQKTNSKDPLERYKSVDLIKFDNEFSDSLNLKNDDHTILSDRRVVESEILSQPISNLVSNPSVDYKISKRHKDIAIVLFCVGVFVISIIYGFSKLYYQDKHIVLSPSTLKQVKIGNQIWKVENMKAKVFRNGDPIDQAKTVDEWVKAGANQSPAWCYYDNDPESASRYGILYNWYAVNDSRGLAPKGWHIPSNKEWNVLIEFLEGEKLAGKKMKNTSGWKENGHGNNESGFEGLPCGARSLDEFYGVGYGGYWWSSSECHSKDAWLIYLCSYDNNIRSVFNLKYYGYSVRCLKD